MIEMKLKQVLRGSTAVDAVDLCELYTNKHCGAQVLQCAPTCIEVGKLNFCFDSTMHVSLDDTHYYRCCSV